MSLPSLYVVGAAIVRDGRCLVAQRSESMSLPLQWEFPGGKVRRDETPQAALEREIREELGVDVSVCERLGRGEAIEGGRRIVLDIYLAQLDAGEIRLAEHRAVGWFAPGEIERLHWAEADRPVVPALVTRLRQIIPHSQPE